jgi:DNA-binding XRE family transcriptional regulator
MLLSGTRALLAALTTASEESAQMRNAASTAGPALVAALDSVASNAIASGYDIVGSGRGSRPDGQIVDPPIAGVDLRTVSNGGQWRMVDASPVFVDELHDRDMTVSDKRNVRLGDPTGGKALAFEVVRPSNSPEELRRDQHQPTETDGQSNEADPGLDPGLDPGIARAGAASAARRRELDISQRSLAADGIINAGALIAFEKGRSWPRERTRAKLEEVLQWPAGTIARIRDGETVTDQSAPAPTPVPDIAPAAHPAAAGPASLIAQAVAAAVDTCSLAIAALPSPEDPEFTERAAPILADLRQLEGIAVQATRISRITPELIKALGAVRRYHDKLMTIGATAPGATLAQRLYAARRRANLSTSETAQAVGVTEELIVSAEAEETLPPEVAAAIEALISQIN